MLCREISAIISEDLMQYILISHGRVQNHLHQYHRFCLRHRDLLNNETDLLKINTFRKLMIHLLLASPLFLLLLKTIFNKKNIKLNIGSAASSGAKWKPTYFVYFSWPPLQAGLSIETFCSLLKLGGKLLFLIRT